MGFLSTSSPVLGEIPKFVAKAEAQIRETEAREQGVAQRSNHESMTDTSRPTSRLLGPVISALWAASFVKFISVKFKKTIGLQVTYLTFFKHW